MANGTFKVKAQDRGVGRALQRLRDAAGNLREPLKNATAQLNRNMKYRFAHKRDPDGRAWAPWAKSTAERYKKDPKHKLMLYTRATRDSTSFIAGRNDIRVRLGTTYAAFHEQPAGPGKGRIPRRAFIFSNRNGGRALSQSDEKYVYNALRYQIQKALK